MLRIFGGIWCAIGFAAAVLLSVAALSQPKLRRMPVLPATLSVAGAVVFAVGVRAQRRVRDLMTRGTEARGEITDVAIDRTQRLNGKHPYRIAYVFTDATGSRVRGTLRRWEAPELARGDAVIVLFDPEDATKNTLWTPLANVIRA